MRSGVLARKLGMSRVFADDGEQIPVTVLALEDCRVVGVRSGERDGYTALQVGAGHRSAKHTAKPQRQEYVAKKVMPCEKVCEFRVSEDMVLDIGSLFSADHFMVGQKVDIAGTTKGRGFSGAMKRWGFKGLRATHGVSVSHRSLGSTGHCQDPGKVFKGKKMAGQYGGDRKTTQNLEVVRTDAERGLLMVRGAVSGCRNSWVEIRDAMKKSWPEGIPFPAGLRTHEQGEQVKKSVGEEVTEEAPATLENEQKFSETETTKAIDSAEKNENGGEKA